MSNILVAYFSASGVTARAAKEIARAVGADLYEIRPAEPYTDADLNWMDKKSRSTREMNDPACRPAITGAVENMEQYDTVFVGFPIWWAVEPRVVDTFLEGYDFSGKTAIPFATSGGSGISRAEKSLEDHCPKADWKRGKLVNSGAAATDEATSAAIPDAQRLTGFMKPYQGGTYAFVALLPPEGMTVEQTLGCLDGDVLAELLENPWYNPVDTYLPKFSYDTEMELVDTLGSLGMADALDPDRADFSGVGPGVPLYISRVLHKTHIEVDQEGTSAAAATAVEMEAGSSAPGEPLEPKTVRLDRPFIYPIVDTTANTLLFLGAYMGA